VRAASPRPAFRAAWKPCSRCSMACTSTCSERRVHSCGQRSLPALLAHSSQAELRLLLVGLDKAGKTSCLEKLRALTLAEPHSGASATAAAAVQLPVAPTVGLNIARFELSGTKLTLWDLGGQARACSEARRCTALMPARAHTHAGWPAQHLGEVLRGHARARVRVSRTLPVQAQHVA